MLASLHDVRKAYQRGGENIDVLRGVSVTIEAGDFLALMGPSGSGKTTLLRVIAGLESPEEGALAIEGRDALSPVPPDRCSSCRSRHDATVSAP